MLSPLNLYNGNKYTNIHMCINIYKKINFQKPNGNVNYCVPCIKNINWKCQLCQLKHQMLQKRQMEMSTAPKTSTENVNCSKSVN